MNSSKTVLFVAPFYTANALKWLERLVEIPGIRPALISQEPLHWLPPAIRDRYELFYQVQNAFDASQIIEAAKWIAGKQGAIHRLLGPTEQLQVALARTREALSIPGMDIQTATNFRDKARMKTLLRQKGIPCAAHCLAATVESAYNFVQQTGFPVVAKPNEGAASQATYKLQDHDGLKQLLTEMPPSAGKEWMLEEFISGDESSFETFSLHGQPVFYSLTHYYPNPLTVMREAWIQWQVVLPREIEDAQYDDIKEAAFQTLDTLGMQTGLTHLEWFRRADGSIAISEVAARPPGAQIMTLLSRANDFDAYTAWLRLMIFDEFKAPQRQYAVGAAFLRGSGSGKVTGVQGMDKVRAVLGPLITDLQLPLPGQEKSTSYEGEGFVIVRHKETAEVKKALDLIVSEVRVRLGA